MSSTLVPRSTKTPRHPCPRRQMALNTRWARVVEARAGVRVRTCTAKTAKGWDIALRSVPTLWMCSKLYVLLSPHDPYFLISIDAFLLRSSTAALHRTVPSFRFLHYAFWAVHPTPHRITFIKQHDFPLHVRVASSHPSIRSAPTTTPF